MHNKDFFKRNDISMFTKIIVVIGLTLVLSGCVATPEELWLAEREDEQTTHISIRYFGLFLAIQNDLVYELAHPDLHPKIRMWIESNEPVRCSNAPSSVGGVSLEDVADISIYCQCDLVLDGITTVFDATKEFYILNGIENIKYINCASDFGNKIDN